MADLWQWLRGMWFMVQTAADSSLRDTQTGPSGQVDHCHLFADALTEEIRLAEIQNQKMADLLEQLFRCRQKSGNSDAFGEINKKLIGAQRKGWEATEAYKAVAVSLQYQGQTIPILTPEQVID